MNRLIPLAACAIAVSVAVVPAVAAPDAAAPAPAPAPAPAAKGEIAKGTITKWEDAAKTCTVKLETPVNGAAEMTFVWNDKTKLQGAGKVGEMVMVRYAAEDGKAMARNIMVGKDAIAVWEAKKKQGGGGGA